MQKRGILVSMRRVRSSEPAKRRKKRKICHTCFGMSWAIPPGKRCQECRAKFAPERLERSPERIATEPTYYECE